MSGVAPLSAQDVSVWCWITDGLEHSALRAQSAVLCHAERVRGERFLLADDRRDFAAAHVLLRHALSSCAAVAPADWQFTTNEYGKPLVVMPDQAFQGITFSLSHTKGLVACAVTRDARVGVDVERARGMSDLLDVARRCFAPAEARSLEAMSPDDRQSRFVELWTLKESYLKATGRGLSVPLDRVAFDLSHLPGLSFSAKDNPCNWQFMLAAPTHDTRLAVAAEGGDRTITPGCVRGAALNTTGTLRLVAATCLESLPGKAL
jgi:4'-phosphopantetheinyl transferase